VKKYKVTERKITDYQPDPTNPNLGSEEGLAFIEKSLREVGGGRSLVADEKDILVAGNKTQEAAVNAGITDVIEIETEGDVLIVHKRRDWDAEQLNGEARRYTFLDNRASELSMRWNPEQVKLNLDAGMKLTDVFDPLTLKKLMNSITGENSGADPNRTSKGQVDKAEQIRAKWNVESGQVWQIPSKFRDGAVHRVMCGDSAQTADVEKLMQGIIPDLSVTSPPYAVGKDYEGATLQDWRAIIAGVFGVMSAWGNIWFVNLGDQKIGDDGFEHHTYGEMVDHFERSYGYKILTTRIWKKDAAWQAAPYWNTTYKAVDEFEYLGVFAKDKPKHIIRVEGQEYNDWAIRGVWDIPSVRANTLHSAQFPVEIPIRAIRLYTDFGGTVHDPFGGSGTTLEAAERLGRTAYLMEKQPHYAAVILDRAESMGLEPKCDE